MEDHELLREFAEQRSDDAFAKLVGRYIDLVYSTAYRMVGEQHLSRDISQMVFVELARKPRAVRNPLALAGWLYRTTRFTAAGVLRKEQRRRQWENRAMELKALESDSEAVWQAVAPHLEAAMSELPPEDQDAVALRFFQGKSLRDVGQFLGTSEDTAQKRVARALDKLRLYFNRQGIGTASTLLASALGAHAVTGAPPGLAASVSSGALASTASTGAGTLLKTIGIMTTTNLKITAAALFVAALVSTPLLLRHRAQTPKPVEGEQLGQSGSTPSAVAATPGDRKAAQAKSAAPDKSAAERLLDAPPLSSAEIEAYLNQNKRTAENLLAAFRVSEDKAYLREAAQKFPNDPAVQFAVIAQDLFSGQRRLWLEAFKTNAPDNALAWYLSAADYFKARQSSLAVEELNEATRRPAFKNYNAQTSQAVEEMYNLAGRPALQAKHAAACGVTIPYLSQLKALGNQVMQEQQQYQQQGDAASANSLLYMGLVLGNRLSTGANNQHVIDQLVGIALEKKFLAQLNPAVTYDFLGCSVREAVAQAEARQQAIKQASTFIQQTVQSLSEADLANFLDREKLYGEPEALAWLQGKYAKP